MKRNYSFLKETLFCWKKRGIFQRHAGKHCVLTRKEKIMPKAEVTWYATPAGRFRLSFKACSFWLKLEVKNFKLTKRKCWKISGQNRYWGFVPIVEPGRPPSESIDTHSPESNQVGVIKHAHHNFEIDRVQGQFPSGRSDRGHASLKSTMGSTSWKFWRSRFHPGMAPKGWTRIIWSGFGGRISTSYTTRTIVLLLKKMYRSSESSP